MALDPNDTTANENFFNKKNESVEPGSTDSSANSMVSTLEAEHEASQDPAVVEGEEFVVVNEEDVKDPAEELPAAEEVPAVESVETDPQLQDIMTTLGGLTELQKIQIEAQNNPQTPVAADVEPELDYSDPEAMKNWVAWNGRESDRKIQDTLANYHKENVAPMQNLTLDQAHKTQISDAKAVHGDRFDWVKDKEAIMNIQSANPSLNVSDAFRHIDYQRLQTEVQNAAEKKVDLAKASSVASGPASTQAKNVGNPITLVATAEDRKMATNFGMPLADWMKSKYNQEQSPGGSLI